MPAKQLGTIGLVAFSGMLLSASAHGQVRTDGTLGAAQALAGPNFAIPASLGQQAGANLFHSFGQFSVPTGGSATFSGPNSVGNIISRVTGADASSIDGRLGSTIPGANLFLINPRGIVFGPNASLDLTGSFYASTANYLRLADGTRFEAAATPAPILTAAPPAAFGFLGPTGEIAFQGTRFDLAAGRGLSAVGGGVKVDGALLRTRAAGLRLASVTAGEVSVDAATTAAAGTTFGAVNITGAQVRTQSSGAAAPGRIVIRGGALTIADSVVRSINAAPGDAPQIELIAAGDLAFSGGQLLASTQGTGRGADIVAKGENITIDRAALVQSWSVASGGAGDIDMAARNALRIVAAPGDPDFTQMYNVSFADGPGGATRLSGDKVSVDAALVMNQASGSGNAGPIAITGREIDLSTGALVATYITSGATGGTGEVRLGASESVVIQGKDWAGNQTLLASWNAGVRRGGDIVVEAPSVTLRESGLIQSNVYAAGRAGDITIRGSRNIEVNGTQGEVSINSIPYYGTTGDGGNVMLESPNILFAGPASIWQPTNGAGNTGNIVIRTHDIEMRTGTAIFTDVAPWSTGQGGNVTVEGTGRLTMATVAMAPFAHWILRPDTASIGAFTAGPGRSGDVTITIPEIYGELQSSIVSFAQGAGDGGNLTVNAQRVKLGGNSLITARAQSWTAWWGEGRSNAGNITLNIGESLEMSARDRGVIAAQFNTSWMNRGGVQTSAFTHGNAGTITINAPRVIMDDAAIEATTSRSGSGGRIELNVDDLILKNGGQVEAKSLPGSSGNAGSIVIAARNLVSIDGMSAVDGRFSGISVETWGTGKGGGIRIDAGEVVLDRGVVKSATSGKGDAGSISIAARNVSLLNGGWIDGGTASGSTGAGGNVDVRASESIVIRGVDRTPPVAVQPVAQPDPALAAAFGPQREQGLFASAISTNTAGSGAGGNVNLNAPSIRIEDGGRVSATSTGTGNAGSIAITAPDALRVFGGSSISSEALLADGGNIDIRAGNRVHLRDSEISTSVGSGQGAGGNIFIDPTFVILENSRIVANAFGGPGGNIRIIADYFLSSPGSILDASSQRGVSGSVQIAALNTNLSNELAALPAQVLDSSAMLRESCTARLASGAGSSSLVGVGRGGLAASPERFAASSYFVSEGAPAPTAATSDGEFSPTGLKLRTAQRARLIVGCAA